MEYQLPSTINLEDLIQQLREIFESDTVDIDYVKNLMKSYKSNQADWKRFAKFDRYR